MPRAKAAVKASEPVEPTTPAFVNGAVTEVPVDRIIFDPRAFQYPRDAATAQSAFSLLQRGRLNTAFIPRLFARPDGIFVLVGLSPRP
jgi:hypothetical protein